MQLRSSYNKKELPSIHVMVLFPFYINRLPVQTEILELRCVFLAFILTGFFDGTEAAPPEKVERSTAGDESLLSLLFLIRHGYGRIKWLCRG